MSTRNRSVSYRKKVQTRRTVITVLIVLGIVLALLFVTFVIVGNRLLKKAEQTPKDSDEKEQLEGELPDYAAPSAIRAYPVLAETTDSSTFRTRVQAVREKGGVAISLPMTNAEGLLCYRSPVAETLGVQSVATYQVRMSSLVEQARNLNVSMSGTFYVNALSETDELLRAVALSKSAAVIAEAIRDGIDDVLLIAPSLTSENQAEFLRFVADIRALAPDAVLGVALSDAFLGDAKADDALNELNAALNYLAFNVTDFGDTDAAEYVDAQIHSAQNQYRFLYYKMRLLIPEGVDDEEQERIIAAAEENGVHNWQILSKGAV